MRCGIRELRISAIIHQTEDENLVVRLIQSLARGTIIIKSGEGYYGGSIKFVENRVAGCDAEQALLSLFNNMDELSRQILLAGIGGRLHDENRIFFRLDKQSLATGRVELGEGDDSVLIEIRVDRSIAKDPITYITKLLRNG